MGFDVRGGVVTVDHSHNKFAITTVEDNPTIANNGDLVIHSAFLRTRTRLRKKSSRPIAGDNCPLIYALKGKHELTTTRRDIHSLNLNLTEIINKFLAESGTWDMVVSLPSSHKISTILARKLYRQMDKPFFSTDLLRKKNIFEVRAEVKGSTLPISDKRYFEKKLVQQRKEVGWGGPYSMKSIDTKMRGKLGPLTINKVPKSFKPSSILIVDDVTSSGTTLNMAGSLIQSLYPGAKVEAFCLFSAGGGKEHPPKRN